eukprot:CAMPEP_0185032216 /NCGR_PEP_ID=MMETSP1103-20130426/20142_1 /TAXON_ID=36769 /ORGANISM="Paraphysomonas bandaiensis, Strain Caron Lab Isolate" /LENGTH=556 /DNA_ID=CAMNT_0027568031 /DNA_START=259 /DNA_END=1929 /DNA_ORIENTATION=+
MKIIPSQHVGGRLRVGDRIVAIDNQSTKGVSIRMFHSLLSSASVPYILRVETEDDSHREGNADIYSPKSKAQAGVPPVWLFLRIGADSTAGMQAYPAKFSGPLSSEYKRFTFAIPEDGCTNPQQGQGAGKGLYSGAFVLIRRGVCSFLSKAVIAAQSGAAGVVIINSEDSAFSVDDPMSPVPLSIPVVMVSRSTGQKIRDAMEQSLSSSLRLRLSPVDGCCSVVEAVSISHIEEVNSLEGVPPVDTKTQSDADVTEENIKFVDSTFFHKVPSTGRMSFRTPAGLRSCEYFSVSHDVTLPTKERLQCVRASSESQPLTDDRGVLILNASNEDVKIEVCHKCDTVTDVIGIVVVNGCDDGTLLSLLHSSTSPLHTICEEYISLTLIAPIISCCPAVNKVPVVRAVGAFDGNLMSVEVERDDSIRDRWAHVYALCEEIRAIPDKRLRRRVHKDYFKVYAGYNEILKYLTVVLLEDSLPNDTVSNAEVHRRNKRSGYHGYQPVNKKRAARENVRQMRRSGRVDTSNKTGVNASASNFGSWSMIGNNNAYSLFPSQLKDEL